MAMTILYCCMKIYQTTWPRRNRQSGWGVWNKIKPVISQPIWRVGLKLVALITYARRYAIRETERTEQEQKNTKKCLTKNRGDHVLGRDSALKVAATMCPWADYIISQPALMSGILHLYIFPCQSWSHYGYGIYIYRKYSILCSRM